MSSLKKPELLAPAGNLEKLKVAIMYGADAVFIGGKEFSLRSSASNFSLSDIKEAVQFANQYNAKVHVTCNIILHNDNLNGLEEYLKELDVIGVQAIIVADPHILEVKKNLGLKLEVHLSTQMSSLNSKSISFFKAMGFDRIVLGREVSYDNLVMIKNNVDIDLEYFVHGAMCIHYSGRCMLSNYFSRRDANRGGCSQSCRWNYDVYCGDEKVNDASSCFTMSSKDMALIDHIDDLIDLGIDSFKIEGRMKSLHYIATIVSTYRKRIDDYCDSKEASVKYRLEILKAANRSLCTGFFNHEPDDNDQLFSERDEHPTQEFIMKVLDYNEETGVAMVEQRNYFRLGDKVEFFGPNHENVQCSVLSIVNQDGESVLVANHPMEILYVLIDTKVEKFDMGRLMNEK